jgi:nicotinate phosphoribosyltransferase
MAPSHVLCVLQAVFTGRDERFQALPKDRSFNLKASPLPRYCFFMRCSVSAFTIDLYELTMAAAYWTRKIHARASFELFVRALPANRNFLIAAGLERALEYLEGFHFAPEEIDFLRTHPAFQKINAGFFDYLADLRFSGEAWAMEEGTPFFPSEPILRITAPVIEAQLFETALLSILGFETTIASKAARVVHAAQVRPVSEFGSRHAHGPDAALYAARSAYLAGCASTSNVEAGQYFGIPLSGTMAHSYVMSYLDEEQSFIDFVGIFGNQTTLLLDTYDTMRALESMLRASLHPRAVRLDSGDRLALSKQVRARLDEAGLQDVKIVVTGDLNEWRIEDLLRQGAPIDSFGVGTEMATSKDEPVVSCVYKLVHFESGPKPHYRAKLSAEKQTYPSCKQVFRTRKPDGTLDRDVLASTSEEVAGGEPLLKRVMANGKRTECAADLNASRDRCAAMRAELPAHLLELQPDHSYRVDVSQRLMGMLEQLRATQGVEP